MQLHLLFITVVIYLAAPLLLKASPPSLTSIPWSQLGAEVQKTYAGEGITVIPTRAGARLKADMQDLEGEATTEGLWLTSTSAEDVSKTACCRVLASQIRREGNPHPPIKLPDIGAVRAGTDGAVLLRPGLVEEYTVSADGVRQDFVILQRPAGTGRLTVNLAITGAKAESTTYGAKLTLHGNHREIAYSRLHVTDANGKELYATMDVTSTDRLAVRVADADATYPVRIDPTFSDADWVSLNPGLPGANGIVYAAVVDGSGNLYVGGNFNVVGTVAANHIAKWNGSMWSALGSGMTGGSGVYALLVKGGELFATGSFTKAGGSSAKGIAKWDGNAWSALGTGLGGGYPYASTLAVIGNELYAGGPFITAGGISAKGIAKWNGSVWSALGTGISEGSATVNALTVIGTDLYAGGNFATAGGIPANSIAKWNGTAWSALGTGTTGTILSMAMSEGNLYVGGSFTTIGGVSANSIAKWNGNAWSALGTGISGSVRALAVSGGSLYAGGFFFVTTSGVRVDHIARWDGSAWFAVGSGMDNQINTLAVSNGSLFAGGNFITAGGTAANGISIWSASVWSALGTGMNGAVRALLVSGSDLYAGGDFTTVGGVPVNCIAKWNGNIWSALGSGMDGSVNALVLSGSDLYAGGDFSTAGGVSVMKVAKWNGNAWSALGSGMNAFSTVRALAVSGSDLYAGGDFTTAGGVEVKSVAKWDGSTWSSLGSGIYYGGVSTVCALALRGSNLFAGGFTDPFGGTTGLQTAKFITKWDGSNWSSLGSGLEGDSTSYVFALAVNGPDLYVGGKFTKIGTVSTMNIAKWDGSVWSALGSGVGSDVFFQTVSVRTLAVSGNSLYAGGEFTTAGGAGARRIAKWNGNAWAPFGSGLSEPVYALAADASNHLFVGGNFMFAGTSVSPYLTQANLPPLSPLENWRQTYFGTTSNTGSAADTADFDSDGISNLMEWASALNPTMSSILSTPAAIRGANIEYTYTRSVASLNAGTVFLVEWSDSLPGANWSTNGVTQSVLSDNGTTQQVKATVPAGSSEQRFVRLKVTAGP